MFTYKATVLLISVLTFVIIWEHLYQAYATWLAGNYFFVAYNLSISILTFLFVAGYIKKFEDSYEKAKKRLNKD